MPKYAVRATSISVIFGTSQTFKLSIPDVYRRSMRRRQINIYFKTLYRRPYDVVKQRLFRRISTNFGMSHRRRRFVGLSSNSSILAISMLWSTWSRAMVKSIKTVRTDWPASTWYQWCRMFTRHVSFTAVSELHADDRPACTQFAEGSISQQRIPAGAFQVSHSVRLVAGRTRLIWANELDRYDIAFHPAVWYKDLMDRRVEDWSYQSIGSYKSHARPSLASRPVLVDIDADATELDLHRQVNDELARC